jgi:hypothetical protein
MTGVLHDTKATLLRGGPYGGQGGEVTADSGGWPLALDFDGFAYKLDHESKRLLVYTYAPELSSAHPGLMRSQAEALQEAAKQRGMTVPQMLDDVRLRRQQASGKPHPAQLLLDEAKRTGTDLFTLVEQHARGELQL